MNIFQETDYKEILRKCLLEKKKDLGRQFTFQRMAEACRIQKTYLSRVLGDEKAHLSTDQLYLACGFLGFGSEERDFALLLLELAKSVVRERRTQLERELMVIRERHLKTEKALSKKKVMLESRGMEDYYLDPYVQLVHLFMTVDRFARNPELARQKLALPKERFSRVIEKLMGLGILVREGARYTVRDAALHLPADSPIFQPHRTLLRMRGIDQLQRCRPESSYSFTVILSTDEKIRKAIQARFLEFLKETEKLVSSAEPTDVYQMSFDLIPWSE